MNVYGYVRMSVSLNVYDLETDAVYKDSYGHVKISDPEQFFSDFVDNWVQGIGELTGASDQNTDLEMVEDEDDLDAEIEGEE